MLRDIGVLFLSPAILIFFAWCIVIGLCTALVWNFLFWHLEELADATENCAESDWMKTLQGLAMGIQCFGGELPFFFLSGWLLKRIGHIHAMSLVLLCFGIRFMLYSVLTNPWWVLPIELMQGVTFGIFYSTMTSYASLVAPSGTEATLQVKLLLYFSLEHNLNQTKIPFCNSREWSALYLRELVCRLAVLSVAI